MDYAVDRRNEVKVYQAMDKERGSVFLFRPGDKFAIEDVHLAGNQGWESFRTTARTWLGYPEVGAHDLSHPSDVYQALFPDESVRGAIRPRAMSMDLLRGIGAQEVASYNSDTDDLEILAEPLPNTRRYLGLPEQSPKQ